MVFFQMIAREEIDALLRVGNIIITRSIKTQEFQ